MPFRASFSFVEAWIDEVSKGERRVDEIGVLQNVFSGEVSRSIVVDKFWYWEAQEEFVFTLSVRDGRAEQDGFRNHLQVRVENGIVGLYSMGQFEEGDVISILAGGDGNKKNALILGGECAKKTSTM